MREEKNQHLCISEMSLNECTVILCSKSYQLVLLSWVNGVSVMSLILNTYLRFHGFQKPEVSNSVQTEHIIANDVLTAVHFSVCMLLRHADGLKCIFFFVHCSKVFKHFIHLRGRCVRIKKIIVRKCKYLICVMLITFVTWCCFCFVCFVTIHFLSKRREVRNFSVAVGTVFNGRSLTSTHIVTEHWRKLFADFVKKWLIPKYCNNWPLSVKSYSSTDFVSL